MKYEEIEVGHAGEVTKTFTEEDVVSFAGLSLDTNPVHLDEEYAAGTLFKRRIVHGMLSASLISAALATKCPGPGSIYLGQELSFQKPVYFGDTLTARVEVIEKLAKRVVVLSTTVTNQNADVVINGKATLKKLG
jgi:3-hydroxybutyryl-CoA dehydratase